MRPLRPSKAILAARAASRSNGALGQGPVTKEGKRNSSRNATRHGLLSKATVLSSESEETFARLVAQHQAKLRPADDVEEGAIEEMASSFWRLRRLWTIETRLFDKSIEKRPETDERDRLAAAFSDLAAGNDLNLLDRYENKLHRMYQRSLYKFLVLRELGARENNQTNLDSDKSI
jgi:hypothetical protein